MEYFSAFTGFSATDAFAELVEPGNSMDARELWDGLDAYESDWALQAWNLGLERNWENNFHTVQVAEKLEENVKRAMYVARNPLLISGVHAAGFPKYKDFTWDKASDVMEPKIIRVDAQVDVGWLRVSYYSPFELKRVTTRSTPFWQMTREVRELVIAAKPNEVLTGIIDRKTSQVLHLANYLSHKKVQVKDIVRVVNLAPHLKASFDLLRDNKLAKYLEMPDSWLKDFIS